MVMGVLSDAGGAEGHEAVLWVRGEVLSLQKLVIACSLWYRQYAFRWLIRLLLLFRCGR